MLILGVLVNRVEAQSACKGILQRHDVLVAVDGHPIACDGKLVCWGHYFSRLSVPLSFLSLALFDLNWCPSSCS